MTLDPAQLLQAQLEAYHGRADGLNETDFEALAVLRDEAHALGRHGTHALSILARLEARYTPLAAHLRNTPPRAVQALFRSQATLKTPSENSNQIALDFLKASLGSHDDEVWQTVKPLVWEFLENCPEHAGLLLTPLLTSPHAPRVLRGLELLEAAGDRGREILLAHAPALFEREECITIALAKTIQKMARLATCDQAIEFINNLTSTKLPPPVDLAIAAVQFRFGFIALPVLLGSCGRLWVETEGHTTKYIRSVVQDDTEFFPFTSWANLPVETGSQDLRREAFPVRVLLDSPRSWQVYAGLKRADALVEKWKMFPDSCVVPLTRLLVRKISPFRIIDEKLKGMAVALMAQWKILRIPEHHRQPAFKTLLRLALTWRGAPPHNDQMIALTLARHLFDSDLDNAVGEMILSTDKRETHAAIAFLLEYPELARTLFKSREHWIGTLLLKLISGNFEECLLDILMAHPQAIPTDVVDCLHYHLSHGPIQTRLKAYVVLHHSLARQPVAHRKSLVQTAFALLPQALKVDFEKPYLRLILGDIQKSIDKGLVLDFKESPQAFEAVRNYFRGGRFLSPETEARLIALMISAGQSLDESRHLQDWNYIASHPQRIEAQQLTGVLHHMRYTRRGSYLPIADSVLSPYFDRHSLTQRGYVLRGNPSHLARIQIRTAAALTRLHLASTLTKPSQYAKTPHL